MDGQWSIHETYRATFVCWVCIDQIIGFDASQRVCRDFADKQTHHDSTGQVVTDVEVIFIPVVHGNFMLQLNNKI